MRELIDRQALKDYVSSLSTHPLNEWDTWGVLSAIDKQPTITAPPWHKVEDGLPEMSAIVPCYVCSEILVLYDAESGYMDIGYVREKPDNKGVDWLWGKPLTNPTHWMPIEPPKEDADGNT